MVAAKQSGIIQRWGVFGATESVAPVSTQRGDDGVDLNHAALGGGCIDAAMDSVKRAATGVGDPVVVVKLDRLLVTDPLQWHAADVGSQNLLLQTRHDTLLPWYGRANIDHKLQIVDQRCVGGIWADNAQPGPLSGVKSLTILEEVRYKKGDPSSFFCFGVGLLM